MLPQSTTSNTPRSLAATLTTRNLHAIIGERDKETRLKAIAELWVPSGEAFFIDTFGIYRTHSAISDMVDKLHVNMTPEARIFEIGEVESLKHDDETDTWVTRIKWGVGTNKDDVTGVGSYVVTIVEGTLHFCYGFLSEKSQVEGKK